MSGLILNDGIASFLAEIVPIVETEFYFAVPQQKYQVFK